MTDAPRKPFWKRKRWIAVAVLWLVLPPLYVLSTGPVIYAASRGWISGDMPHTVYYPLLPVTDRFPAFTRWLNDYTGWWWTIGLRHRVQPIHD
jgi:hypothetical protein